MASVITYQNFDVNVLKLHIYAISELFENYLLQLLHFPKGLDNPYRNYFDLQFMKINSPIASRLGLSPFNIDIRL